MRTLDCLVEEEADFVVVGGYAVTGLGKHRFSVDCDIVISKAVLGEIEAVLKRCGYERDIEKTGFDYTYAGEFVRYKKKVGELPVTFDLLVGSLVCRTTGAAWSFEYIKKHSGETTIGGNENRVKCRVPERELVIAFKIHSARRTDVRDTVMLMEDSDMSKVITHLRRGKAEVLKKQVSDIIEMLNDKRLIDSLKGVFSLTIDVRKQIIDVRKKMENLSKELSI
ncbi:MAG: hypothetical protein IAX22_08325 [Candidatus Bathyarchaeota archaeon]|nr:hypothetical protein [Candidatus Bathyarchaeota archaeon]